MSFREAKIFFEKLQNNDFQISAESMFEYSNGDRFEADLVRGERHGQGKMTYLVECCVYEGEWVHGLHEGHGTKTWAVGIEYVGEWKAGLMHGQGKYTMSDGFEMEGLFQNDEFIEERKTVC